MQERLTQEAVKRVLSYNPEDGVFRWIAKPSNRSNRIKVGDRAGWIRGRYLCIGLYGNSYLAHVLAHLYMTGRFPDGEVDHIDHDGLNNRWDNLRVVSHKENGMNQRLSKNNTSGVNGVSWIDRLGKYRAYITVDRKQINLGLFRNLEDAIAARSMADLQYGFHGNHGANLGIKLPSMKDLGL